MLMHTILRRRVSVGGEGEERRRRRRRRVEREHGKKRVDRGVGGRGAGDVVGLKQGCVCVVISA
jgi:hypothetical protein